MDFKELYERHGQSIWLDFIRRDLLSSGDFARQVEVDGVRGVTTNPSIFEKAIDGSDIYRADLSAYRAGAPAAEVYEHLAVADIRAAADILLPLYRSSGGRDGFVSMEVAPPLARDTQGTVAEGLRLRQTVDRANLMIKVPATPEGLPAIRALLGRGANVNVTLLFSRAACHQVAEAHAAGLEDFAAAGGDPATVASVASLFVSRLDALLDPQLRAAAEAAPQGKRAGILALTGQGALANAKLAYQDWKAWIQGPRWKALAAQGARPQRLLWASTGTKDKALSDVHYVEGLIGPDTVDTVPPATLKAFQDHGRAENRLEQDLDGARATLAAIRAADIDLDAATDRLLEEGLASFGKAFTTLLESIERQRAAAGAGR